MKHIITEGFRQCGHPVCRRFDHWSVKLSVYVSVFDRKLLSLLVLSLVGVQAYHRTVQKNIEIDGEVILPSPTIALNNNNINLAQKTVLEEHPTSDGAENPYAILRACNRKFYSLMHYRIQKFARVEWHLCAYIIPIKWNSTYVLGPVLHMPKMTV